MHKKKKKKHARGKATCEEVDKPKHIRVRFLEKGCNGYNPIK
jgi:hypothetical protein